MFSISNSIQSCIYFIGIFIYCYIVYKNVQKNIESLINVLSNPFQFKNIKYIYNIRGINKRIPHI